MTDNHYDSGSNGLVVHRDTQTWTLIVHGVEHELTAQEYLDLRKLFGAS